MRKSFVKIWRGGANSGIFTHMMRHDYYLLFFVIDYRNSVLIRLRDGSQRRPKTHWQQFGLHAALRIFMPILFPIIQRGHGDFRVFRIRPMHRLGIVP